MEENKILFSVTTEGDGSAVKFNVGSSQELFAVALAIYQVLSECHHLKFMVSTISVMSKDKEFRETLENTTTDLNAISAFENILKNIK